MEFVRQEAPYLTPKADVASIMLQVLLALTPAFAVHALLVGPRILLLWLLHPRISYC